MPFITDTKRLLDVTRPFLMTFDEDGLRRYLAGTWGPAALRRLLAGGDHNAAKIAALGLGVLKDDASADALIRALAHEDAMVASMAEYALWTIWFGQHGEDAEAQLRRAVHLPYAEALELLDDLVRRLPDWAEVYNQRAIAHFRGRCFVSALDDCKEALDRQPQHFGALAGLAHSYAQLGVYSEAERCYMRALRVHPRLHGIRQSLRTVRQLASGRK